MTYTAEQWIEYLGCKYLYMLQLAFKVGGGGLWSWNGQGPGPKTIDLIIFLVHPTSELFTQARSE